MSDLLPEDVRMEGEVLPTSPEQPVAEFESPKSELRKKLDNLRQTTAAITQQTVSEVEIYLGLGLDEEKLRQMSADEAYLESQRITDKDNNQQEDPLYVSFLQKRMDMALADLENERDPLVKRFNDLSDQLHSYSSADWWRDNSQGREEGFVKKIIETGKYRDRERKRKLAQQEGDQLAEVLNNMNFKRRDYQQEQKYLHQLQRIDAVARITKGATEIKKQYGEFYDEVVENSDLVLEVRRLFVEQRITPLIANMVESGRIDQSLADEAINQIMAIPIPDISNPYGVTPEIPDELGALLQGPLYEVRQYVEQVVGRGEDKQLIENLISNLAYEDLNNFEERVKNVQNAPAERLNSYDWTSPVESALKKVKNPRRNSSWPGERIEGPFKIIAPIKADNSWQSMYVFSAAKELPGLIDLFGDVIAEEDHRIYEESLEKSLTDRDGGYIDNLVHYRTPESLRNLIILAAADSQQYRTNHANIALTNLAAMEDWPQTVDTLISSYPTLQSSRDYLLTWEWTEYSNNIGVQNAFREFMVGLANDTEINNRLRELAIESLPNSSLLEILHTKGAISDSEFSSINRGYGYVENLQDLTYQERVKGYSSRYLNINGLQHLMRDVLFDLMKNGDEADNLKVVGRLAELSDMIWETRGDFNLTEYFTREAVINAVTGTDIDIGLIRKLYSQAHMIVENNSALRLVLENSANILRNEEDIKYLNTLYKLYDKHDTNVLYLYRDGLIAGVMDHQTKKQFLDVEFLDKLFSLPDGRSLYAKYSAAVISGAVVLDNKDRIYDIDFLQQIANLPSVDHAYLMDYYITGIQNGTINYDRRGMLLGDWISFSETFTAFTSSRSDSFSNALQSPFGKAVRDLISNSAQRNQLILDYACFSERFESVKMGLLINAIRKGYSQSEVVKMSQYLRWLPEGTIGLTDSIEDLAAKYELSQIKLRQGFSNMFPSINSAFHNRDNVSQLTSRLNNVCSWFGLKSQNMYVDGVNLSLPDDFIREFNRKRRQGMDVQLTSELAVYVVNKISQLSTAYALEDLTYAQIADTEDRTGRRRGMYTPEELLGEMENNVEASLITWEKAIAYQKETPEKPLFIIANERTGPADLAAEYLPEDFASRFGISREVDYDRFYEWVQQSRDFIGELYDELMQGHDVSGRLPAELNDWLGTGENKIIPLYRLKIPSSLNAALKEPDGIDVILDVLKLNTLMGGKTMFMDESTRSAPRSIECLYNVLNRRQDAMGGVDIKLLGKIKDAIGQNNTKLNDVANQNSTMEIAMIDPWHSSNKPVNDDSVGFVPDIQGDGIVEVVKPSYTSVNPYGVGTIQDFWKQMIATEVAFRYEGFTESGGTIKRKEQFRSRPAVDEEILTQTELRDMALNQQYRALVVDLDGTLGLRGKYSERALERIKNISASGADVVVGTARSMIDHPEYSGSIQSFLDQLGELTDQQKQHIHLATENASVITTLADVDNPHIDYPIPEEAFDLVERIRNVNPGVNAYIEYGTVILRDFDQEQKQGLITNIKNEIENLGLSLTVGSDSKRSIAIRTRAASKRNILDWLESKGIGINQIAKIGDTAEGNDRPMFWGVGAFNVGDQRNGTAWTVHMDDYGGGIIEAEELLDKLKFQSMAI